MGDGGGGGGGVAVPANNKVERLAVAAHIAPSLRSTALRRVARTDKNGNVIGYSDIGEIQQALIGRAKIEIDVHEGTRPRRVVCDVCGKICRVRGTTGRPASRCDECNTPLCTKCKKPLGRKASAPSRRSKSGLCKACRLEKMAKWKCVSCQKKVSPTLAKRRLIIRGKVMCNACTFRCACGARLDSAKTYPTRDYQEGKELMCAKCKFRKRNAP